MIRANLLDGGTRPVYVGDPPPGREQVQYVHPDYEYELPPPMDISYHKVVTNPEMERGGRISYVPWEGGLPYHMWVDPTERYDADQGGLTVELHHHDRIIGDGSDPSHYSLAPGGDAKLHYQGVVQRGGVFEPRRHARMGRGRTVEESQAVAEETPVPTRLPTLNEDGATTDLLSPVTVEWEAVRGAGHVLVVPDNPLFTPFDLRYPERYLATVGGEAVENPVEAWKLHEGGTYNIQLRPRKWRWVAQVLCHFEFISWFETVPNDEVFLRTSWDRPPVWRVRHELLQSRYREDVTDFYGTWYPFDRGIDHAWTHSRAQSSLREEIYQQQYLSLCVAYIFLSNEDPLVDIWLSPPQPYETVCTIGRVDPATGKESLVSVQQVTDLGHVYPEQFIATYLVRWRIPPGSVF